MRLYEFLNGKLVPYWLRNGLVAGIGYPIPASELFRINRVKRIGRGQLRRVRRQDRIVLALLAQCDPDTRALVMTDALDRFDGGFIWVAEPPHFVIELLSGGSITIRGRSYIWNGRDLKRI